MKIDRPKKKTHSKSKNERVRKGRRQNKHFITLELLRVDWIGFHSNNLIAIYCE